ncbi:MAG: hypothetical protein HWQ41_29920 [Nostoc sp. NOS(2021)]|uniref:hypothetical protein n=1 Tax=Nostoc sp. NOS(2021) TaxID=2815407 RepID=UPI0025F5C23F|nr:hypothetical protein [Nostoc sp. NOS(2021)]MBN3899335.1 hypothetical protein [Nostoc sp. NOS(2021)]
MDESTLATTGYFLCISHTISKNFRVGAIATTAYFLDISQIIFKGVGVGVASRREARRRHRYAGYFF